MDNKPETLRPVFPKRAVVTAGMPYGNKDLHIGHIGAVFIHADTYARFLRDRIGPDNVLFISGTDCYGSPIFEHHRRLVSAGMFTGSLEELAERYHRAQKETLDAYSISLDLFAASGTGPARAIHTDFSGEFIRKLHLNGHLKKMTTLQFYDTEYECFLNGRQVTGKCPVEGCASDKGYADECALGHQYMPAELIDPVSTLSGRAPEMREAVNWYFKLDEFKPQINGWLDEFSQDPAARRFSIKSIAEFLEPPVIFVKKEFLPEIAGLDSIMPEYELFHDEKKSSVSLVFRSLEARENACRLLSDNGIRFRTGKTLVPFRLTSNIKWGVPAPELERKDTAEAGGNTVWVWPESLWAPISFTKTYLNMSGKDTETWRDWWCSKRSGIYQFLGEDNVYFYGPAEMAMFMGYNRKEPSPECREGELQLPAIVVNNHLLFMNKKASSSGESKPPTARELLEHYTPEQLRAHFLALGLSYKSAGFNPKPFDPEADPNVPDPVLKDGNLLTNVFNRFARTCFYASQNYFGGRIPIGGISPEVLEDSGNTVYRYERLMFDCEFHLVMSLMDGYIRNMNKYASKYLREADVGNDMSLRNRALANMFHMLRTATSLMHPIAPGGTEMIYEYLNLEKPIWSWDSIFETIYYFMEDPHSHTLKYLPPKTDFFKKHPSQY